MMIKLSQILVFSERYKFSNQTALGSPKVQNFMMEYRIFIIMYHLYIII